MRKMATSPAFPGLFFCFSAMVLLIFVSVSVPVWSKVSFLNITTDGNAIKFGVWGYTGSAKGLGYSLQPFGINDSFLNNGALKNLTYILVFHPVAAGLSFLSVVFGACGALNYSRFGAIFMTLVSALAFLITAIAFAVDMVLWDIVRSRIRNDGGSANLGNAIWMTLGALVALIFGSCAAGCGSFGRYRQHRQSHHF
ncbi:actin cortical patch SUR7/pH-response regulator pali [Cantharellus anzutake]|uniref:actin cortical patch SUR7/pH-response regulator pali n=1 Tax=Cantharellus anzutake TaxID=1750568 RepID=UPI001906D793|nr:actin cortical patch SUR7/pH-response regulator pali [Cantharellus anzutake]KAF8343875.1 actin cortical patch SUR7/pH-response regulator pali [Cantharellus anzutake]